MILKQSISDLTQRLEQIRDLLLNTTLRNEATLFLSEHKRS